MRGKHEGIVLALHSLPHHRFSLPDFDVKSRLPLMYIQAMILVSHSRRHGNRSCPAVD